MRHRLSRLTQYALIVGAALMLSPLTATAQMQTVGLFLYDSTAEPGYNLFSPGAYTNTYLIDMWGRLIHEWDASYQPAFSEYLLENGDLLRTAKMTAGGGAGGRIQKFDWDGNLIWDYLYFTSDVLQHHDIQPLPNGNVLILAWEDKTLAEATAAGRDPALLPPDELSPEHVVEVEPTGATTGNIVWEWHAWDHIIQDYDSTKANYGVVGDHPELLDVNFGSPNKDWMHGNSIDYNPDLDQIIISARAWSEVWIIDHSTTTAEAAGHTGGNGGMGGDILYRWGNPLAYRAGSLLDQKLFGQHDARWIPSGLPGAGHILVFNNGRARPPSLLSYSTVDEIVTTVDVNGQYPQPSPGVPHGPADPVWSYGADPPTDWYAENLSSSQRFANGQTLICSGPEGVFFDVTPDSQITWKYISPVDGNGINAQGDPAGTNRIFRCTRYPADYAGFVGRDLTPGAAIETYPITITGTAHTPAVPSSLDSIIVTSTIESPGTLTVAELLVDYGAGFQTWTLLDDGNHHDGGAGDGLYGVALPPAPGETTLSYYVHAEDDLAASVNDPPNPPSTVYWIAVCCPVPNIYLNELMTLNNTCCQDEHGDFDPWIELYSYENEPVNLTGMYLTNVLDDTTMFPIGDVTIPAMGHVVFWADGETGQGAAHTNFILNSAGGQIGLYHTDASRHILIDSVTYAAVATDVSYGRAADGAPAWTEFVTPTPNAANSACACLHQGDSEPDGFLTALDLANCIDVLFAGHPDIQDPGCTSPRFDIDCDGFSTALDLAKLIDHLFAGGAGPCDPCAK